jgi:hypothetical protein
LDGKRVAKLGAFSQFCPGKKKRNLIVKLKDPDGAAREGNNHIKPIITNSFTDLFSSEVAATDANLLQKVKLRATMEINEHLMAPFTEEEVKKTLFAIGDFKAPGTDGMHAIFFKNFWPFDWQIGDKGGPRGSELGRNSCWWE